MKKDDVKKEKTITFRKVDVDRFDEDDLSLEDTKEIRQIEVSLNNSSNIDNDDLEDFYVDEPFDDSDEDMEDDFDDDFDDEEDDEDDERAQKKELKRRLKIEKRQQKRDKKSKKTIDVADVKAQRKQMKIHRRFKKGALILILLSICAIVFITRELWIPKLEGVLEKPHSTIVNDGVTQAGNFPIKLGDSSVNNIQIMDNNIVIADDSRIYYYDVNGKLRDSISHSFADPFVKVCDDLVLSYDGGGYTFSVNNKNGEVYKKTIDNQILFADIAPNGNVAIVAQTEKYVACLTIYDEHGEEIYLWSCAQRIMDITFNSSGDSCYASVFSSDDGEIASQIQYVELDKSETVMKSAQLDSLILDCGVNNNGNIWAIGDDKTYLLDSEGKILGSYEYGGELVSYSLNRKCAAIAVEGIKHESSKLAIFKSDDEGCVPKVIESDMGSAKRVSCVDNKVFMLTSNTVDAYDRSGNFLATATVSSEYTEFLYYNDAVYLVGLRQINKILFEN